MKRLLRRLQRVASILACDARGNVATLAALALIPLTMLVGMNVDYHRGVAANFAIAEALDSGALAAARARLGRTLTDAELTRIAQTFFDAALAHQSGGARCGSVSATFNVESESVRGSVSCTYPTLFQGLIGVDQIALDVENEVKTGVSKELELALVVDTTGSMGGVKIDTLKDVSSDMARTLLAYEKVRMSVVPFADYVNVGLAFRDEPGLSIPEDEPGTQSCGMTMLTEPYDCVTVSRTCSDDGGPSYDCSGTSCSWRETGVSEYQCSTHGDATWRGVVGSRREPFNRVDISHANPIPGVMNERGPTSILPLTDVEADVVAKVEDLSPSGETYLPAGIEWGWRVLSPAPPFTQGVDPSVVDVRKIVVFMSDGQNTRSKRDADSMYHDGSDAAYADELFAELCENVKADGIEIFTIAFNVDDVGTRNMLRACASSDAQFYNSVTPAQLETAFVEITGSIRDIYLSQ